MKKYIYDIICHLKTLKDSMEKKLVIFSLFKELTIFEKGKLCNEFVSSSYRHLQYTRSTTDIYTYRQAGILNLHAHLDITCTTCLFYAPLFTKPCPEICFFFLILFSIREEGAEWSRGSNSLNN